MKPILAKEAGQIATHIKMTISHFEKNLKEINTDLIKDLIENGDDQQTIWHPEITMYAREHQYQLRSISHPPAIRIYLEYIETYLNTKHTPLGGKTYE